ncbi:MAG: hypothetical protein A3H39_18635 [candidate division NC10 bacterium RIFCSPLOWO2_02_FULL_66_22]|nr:MAG: hypothetical protein A3H39_18635 [candidate division NC10 bacterium RIFCSPLOWO2_02_FULL_66_22]
MDMVACDLPRNDFEFPLHRNLADKVADAEGDRPDENWFPLHRDPDQMALEVKSGGPADPIFSHVSIIPLAAPESEAFSTIPKVENNKYHFEQGRTLADVWLSWTLFRALRHDRLPDALLTPGREAIPWAAMEAVQIPVRLCEPRREPHLIETWYRPEMPENLFEVPGTLLSLPPLWTMMTAPWAIDNEGCPRVERPNRSGAQRKMDLMLSGNAAELCGIRLSRV